MIFQIRIIREMRMLSFYKQMVIVQNLLLYFGKTGYIIDLCIYLTMIIVSRMSVLFH